MSRKSQKPGDDSPEGAAKTGSSTKRTEREQTRAAFAAARRERAYPWIVVAAALAVYAQTLAGGFTYDDVPIVAENPLITSLANAAAIFRTDYWGGTPDAVDRSLYRPLTILSYAINHALHGLRPAGYHFVNILLHAAASLVLFLLVRDLSGKAVLAFVAALWFAVHPIHTEAVAGVVGRAELLSFLGIALCAWCYVRGLAPANAGGSRRGYLWLAASVAAFAAGLFSKETGIVAPALILISEALYPSRRRLLRLDRRALAVFAAYALVLGLYFVLRSNAVSGRSVIVGFAGVPADVRILTGLRVCFEYVRLLVFPRTLSADYDPRDVPLSTGFSDPGVLLACAALAAACVFLAWGWRRMPDACWGLLFFAVALFPVSNILFAAGFMKAERILYAPSAGFLVAMAALILRALDRGTSRTALWAVALGVAAAFAARTAARNPDWRDNERLAAATLRTSPSSVTMNTLMFNWHRARGRNDLARPFIARALAAEPDNRTVLRNFGNLEMDEKHAAAAEGYYRRALAQAPGDAGMLNNLGRALQEQNRLDEAAATYEEMRRAAPDHPGSYINLMDLYARMKKPASALPLAGEAVRRFPNVAAVQWNAAAIYQALGRTNEMQAALQRARELDRAAAGNRP
jgi:protein O-mannosyl-transferase